MIILTENEREELFPFTHTRHTADIRIGILTIREKWALLGEEVSIHEADEGINIAANIIPTKKNYLYLVDSAKNNRAVSATEDIMIIQKPWNIFQYNDEALRNDFELLTAGRTSAGLSKTNQAVHPENIFIEEGASVEYCIINASDGPVYIGKNAEIMEGCLLRGPLSIGENSKLKMGTKIYGATTIGPGCVAGGEIKNSVLFANSNKAHDGYLGDSVLGEWCNLGAGTSNSNVKNTGAAVGYIIAKDRPAEYAGNKAGLLMGDYSRCAINTSFNTGTVVGVCCNIFDEKMPPKCVENFSWGQERYIFDKAIKDIDNWKKMKNNSITDPEIKMLKELYDQ